MDDTTKQSIKMPKGILMRELSLLNNGTYKDAVEVTAIRKRTAVAEALRAVTAN